MFRVLRHVLDHAGHLGRPRKGVPHALSMHLCGRGQRRRVRAGRDPAAGSPVEPDPAPRVADAALVTAVLTLTPARPVVAEPMSLRSCLAVPTTGSVVTAAAAAGCAALPSAAGAGGGVSCALVWGEQFGPAPLQRALSGRVSLPLCGYTGPQLRALYGLAGAAQLPAGVRTACRPGGAAVVTVAAYGRVDLLTLLSSAGM